MGMDIDRQKEFLHIYAINDPLGQTHTPTSSNPYSQLRSCIVLRDFDRWGRTDGRHV